MIHYKYGKFVEKLRNKVIKEAKNSKKIDSWFLSEHLMVVEKYSNFLCDKYPSADRDIVGLGVWFHDIGRLRGMDEGHDIYGADEAKKVLKEEGYPDNKIMKVYDVCRSHRSKDVKPDSIEAKILATADAMSHFTHSFYFRLFLFYKDNSFEEIKDMIRQKLERDYNEKISFEEGRNKVKQQYDALKLVLEG